MEIAEAVRNCYPHGCPCGFYGDSVKECSCSAMAIARYQKKISGPLLDRIDIHVEVPRVDYEKLADKRNVEDSKTIRARVQATRERQVESFLQISLCLGIFPDASYDGEGEPLLRAGKEYIRAER
jgi:Magnesium chelatase, subunit ChlI